MDAPIAILWLWTLAFAMLAAPCCYRLAVAADPHHPHVRQNKINRVDEAAELLMCLGMLAMVSPLGGPVPLAGWQALFVVSAVVLGVLWWRRRGPSSQCGHHAMMAVLMLYMLLGMPHGGHSADPWLTMAGHGGSLAFWPLAALAILYCVADIGRGLPRALQAPAGHGVVGERARVISRIAGSAGMGAMFAAML